MHDLSNIEAIARRVAESSGLELVEVEMRGGGGKGRMLRVVIDRPERQQSAVSSQQSAGKATAKPADMEEGPTSAKGGQIWGTEGDVLSQAGVTHEDCANVSREISAILDVEEAIPGGAYTLEVSSPGLDRKLGGAQDFARFTGSRVKLMTREPVENNRHWEGRLQAFDGARLRLDVSAVSKTKQKKMGVAGRVIEIELANVERANLVPEI